LSLHDALPISKLGGLCVVDDSLHFVHRVPISVEQPSRSVDVAFHSVRLLEVVVFEPSVEVVEDFENIGSGLFARRTRRYICLCLCLCLCHLFAIAFAIRFAMAFAMRFATRLPSGIGTYSPCFPSDLPSLLNLVRSLLHVRVSVDSHGAVIVSDDRRLLRIVVCQLV